MTSIRLRVINDKYRPMKVVYSYMDGFTNVEHILVLVHRMKVKRWLSENEGNTMNKMPRK